MIMSANPSRNQFRSASPDWLSKYITAIGLLPAIGVKVTSASWRELWEIQSIFNADSAGKCKPPPPAAGCVTQPANLADWWRAEGNTNEVGQTGWETVL